MSASRPTAAPFTPRELRAALGCFATGVAIVTTVDASGAPLGITVNSFNSVSLDPPLVLFSLARSAYSLAPFAASGHWAVNILSARQHGLSERFARAGAEKFAGVAFDAGAGGAPVLRDCAANLECAAHGQVDGGDHVIFIGRVLALRHEDSPSLVFHRGRYATAVALGAGIQPA